MRPCLLRMPGIPGRFSWPDRSTSWPVHVLLRCGERSSLRRLCICRPQQIRTSNTSFSPQPLGWGCGLYFTMILPGRLSTSSIKSFEIERNYSGRDPLSTASTVFPRGADYGRPSATLLGIFYALEMIGGQIGFPLVLFIIGIRQTTLPGIRHPLFLNFYVTWVISSLSFCLLSVYTVLGKRSSMLTIIRLYTGTQSAPQPPLGVCIPQAILIYSVPVL
jgi:hypothetical protein